MEVIKHGNTYKEAECKRCGALLSYCEADMHGEGYGEFCCIKSKRNTYEEYITCPECRTKIILKRSLCGKEQIHRDLLLKEKNKNEKST